MHTKCSDGTDSVEELLKRVEEKKLNCISITDHNTCKAYEELKKLDVNKLYSGKIIPGVELNTKILSIPIEVLGLGIDTKMMQELIEKIYITNDDRRKIEIERLEKLCKKNGFKIPSDFVKNYDILMWPSKYFHKILTSNIENKKLIDEESWNDSNIFYRKFMSNPKTMFFVNMDDKLPEFSIVLNMIKECGGKVIIPHIYEYRDNSMKILENILVNYKIDGIECYYTTFTDKQSTYLLNLCKEKNLLISGGSDYHGKNKVNVEVGIGYGNLNIPDNILNNWNVKYIK